MEEDWEEKEDKERNEGDEADDDEGIISVGSDLDFFRKKLSSFGSVEKVRRMNYWSAK